MLFNRCLTLLLISILAVNGCQNRGREFKGGQTLTSSAFDISCETNNTLKTLYAGYPDARELAKRSKGILVFPNVVKAGFLLGAQFGISGELLKNCRATDYYNIIAGSYGLQAGMQSFSYVMFFMDDDSLSYLNRSEGWEFGAGRSIVVVNQGIGKNLTTTTARSGVYAFIFSQIGLMAGLGLQGSKISRINPI